MVIPFASQNVYEFKNILLKRLVFLVVDIYSEISEVIIFQEYVAFISDFFLPVLLRNN